MSAVLEDAVGLSHAGSFVNVLQGQEFVSSDELSCSHHSLKSFAVGRRAVAVPYSDAASQNALFGAIGRSLT